MVYAVIPFEDHNPKVLERKLKGLGTLYKTDSSEVYFVNYGGSLESLYYILEWGTPNSNSVGDGIALPVNQYVGYGPKALWGWLSTYVR